MSTLDDLAVFQEFDTRLDQLAHRRENLPERGRLVELAERRRELSARNDLLEGQRHQLERERKRFEDEVSSVDAKIEQETGRLYGGGITSPKDAQALQDEIAGLKRHRTTLEDEELEIMEKEEPIESALAVVREEMERDDTEATTTSERITVVEAEIDAEIADVTADKNVLAADLPPDLLTEYQRRRDSWGGVVVGRLTGSTCSGCSLALPAVEIDRIRHLDPDQVVDCPECGVILVR